MNIEEAKEKSAEETAEAVARINDKLYEDLQNARKEIYSLKEELAQLRREKSDAVVLANRYLTIVERLSERPTIIRESGY